jgi:predicted LPLAT superfamily acyltransferase
LHGGRSVTVDFLGHQAAFPQGPWLLAGLLKCPINLLMCLKKPSGQYRVTLEPFTHAVVWKRSDREQVIHQWATRYAERLSHYCLEAPQQWFNFYPFWKTDDDANA